jgi:hypothetical protein
MRISPERHGADGVEAALSNFGSELSFFLATTIGPLSF